MEQLLVVALVCASGTQGPDCTRETALDVITSTAHTTQECLMVGPTLVTNRGDGDGKPPYVKVLCERRR